MSPSSCSDRQYLSATGHCCRLCDAGTHKLKDCNRTTETQCGECGRGYFMAAMNSLDKCLQCKSCNSRNQEPKQLCTARKDTVCACVSGFFCSEDSCDHCRRVSPCPEGHGVRTPGTQSAVHQGTNHPPVYAGVPKGGKMGEVSKDTTTVGTCRGLNR